MNISPVSFRNINKYNEKKMTVQNQQQAPVQKNSETQKHQNMMNLIAGGIAVLLINNFYNAGCQNKPYIATVTVAPQTSITEIADIYNISEDIILAFNNIKDINDTKELKIPKSYDYIQKEIDNKRKELYLRNMSSAQKQENENTINMLLKKQQEQKNVAVAYTDGITLNLLIDIKENNLTEKLKDKYQFGINIESLKRLFDIEDGAIESNNDIEGKWIVTGDNEGYWDYTLNWFKNGDIVKVPIKAIKTDNIDLREYHQ